MARTLSTEEIKEIKKLFNPKANGNGQRGLMEGSKAWLAKRFGVSVHRIRQILYDGSIPTEQVMARFMKYVRKTDDGCWLWTGGVDKDGYGGFGWTQVGVNKAHHASYRLFKGDLPKGKTMRLHSCDVRACVNPDHLFPGTSRENIDDMVQKGRSLKGERHPQSKLTWDQVREIRRLYVPRKPGMPAGMHQDRHEGSQAELAERFGVSKHLVKLIIHNRAWIETKDNKNC